MFFDDSSRAMEAFVASAMGDLALLMSEVCPFNLEQNDSTVFIKNYRNSILKFSQKLVGHTAKLRRNSSVPPCHYGKNLENNFSEEINLRTGPIFRRDMSTQTNDDNTKLADKAANIERRASPVICSRRVPAKRQMLNFEQTTALHSAYSESPFISPQKCYNLAKELNLTTRQVKIWFQNRRFKDKKMFFDDSHEAMAGFAAAVMNDLAKLLSDIESVKPGSMDDSTFIAKYRHSMTHFSQKLAGHTTKLRRPFPNNSALLLQQINDASKRGLLMTTASRGGEGMHRSFRRDMAVQTDLKLMETTKRGTAVQTAVTIPVDSEDTISLASMSPCCYSTPITPPSANWSPSNSNSSIYSKNKNNPSERRAKLSGPKRMLRFEQTAILRSIYAKNAFISADERNKLAKDLKLSAQQIKIWFQNRRFKDKVKTRQQELDEERNFN